MARIKMHHVGAAYKNMCRIKDKESMSSSATFEKPKQPRLVVKLHGRRVISSLGADSRNQFIQRSDYVASAFKNIRILRDKENERWMKMNYQYVQRSISYNSASTYDGSLVNQNWSNFSQDIPEESVASSATVVKPKPTRLVVKFLGKRDYEENIREDKISSPSVTPVEKRKGIVRFKIPGNADERKSFLKRLLDREEEVESRAQKRRKSPEEESVSSSATFEKPKPTRLVVKFMGKRDYEENIPKDKTSSPSSTPVEKRNGIVRFKIPGNADEKKAFLKRLLDREEEVESRSQKRTR